MRSRSWALETSSGSGRRLLGLFFGDGDIRLAGAAALLVQKFGAGITFRG
jgi:hypothetical protein